MRLRGNRFLFKFPFREFGHKSLIKKARNGMKVFLFANFVPALFASGSVRFPQCFPQVCGKSA